MLGGLGVYLEFRIPDRGFGPTLADFPLRVSSFSTLETASKTNLEFPLGAEISWIFDDDFEILRLLTAC